MDERSRRIARARLLRRDGKTYDEIRAVIGSVDDSTLRTWLRGIPRPRDTLRKRARDDLRRECRRLRAQGMTYGEIAARTGASKGSISPWVADVSPTRAGIDRRATVVREQRRNGAAARKAAAARVRDGYRSRASDAFGPAVTRDLFVAGIALYWAEGVKDKPWRRNGRVALINSDPQVLEVFEAWLDLVGVAAEDRRYRLQIHETADVRAAEIWWADRLGVPHTAFARATLKRHNPTTVRLNSGTDYHGCLVVTVARSGWLYYAIEGWWRALWEGVMDESMVHTGNRKWSPVG